MDLLHRVNQDEQHLQVKLGNYGLERGWNFLKGNLDKNFNPELLKGVWTAHTAVVADEPVTSFYLL